MNCYGWLYVFPKSFVTSFFLVRLDMVNTEGPYIGNNGYLCGSNPPAKTISLSPLLSFGNSSLEASTPPVFNLDIYYQCVFNALVNLQLSMVSVDWFPMPTPNPIQYSVVVTPPTLWWCTSIQDKFLLLYSLTLYPPYINTSILSFLIPPPHTFLTNLGYPEIKN